MRLFHSLLSFDVTRSTKAFSDCSSGSRNSTSTPKFSFTPRRAAASMALICSGFMLGKRGLTTWATFSVAVPPSRRGSGSVARCAHDEPAMSSVTARTDRAWPRWRILFPLVTVVIPARRSSAETCAASPRCPLRRESLPDVAEVLHPQAYNARDRLAQQGGLHEQTRTHPPGRNRGVSRRRRAHVPAVPHPAPRPLRRQRRGPRAEQELLLPPPRFPHLRPHRFQRARSAGAARQSGPDGRVFRAPRHRSPFLRVL